MLTKLTTPMIKLLGSYFAFKPTRVNIKISFLINVTSGDKKGLEVLGPKWIFQRNNGPGLKHDKGIHA